MASIRDHGPGAARGTKHDFDFLFGSWKVHNRYLKGRLRGSTEWVEFDADADTQPVLDGLGNLDQSHAVRNGEPIKGVTLRLFNPATGESVDSLGRHGARWNTVAADDWAVQRGRRRILRR